jgi:hypothetical protein
MKKIFKSVLTLGLVAGLGFAANAQKTSTAPASATILADLTITLDGTQNEIAFGNVSATTPGAVVLDANGATGNANTGTTTNVARFDLAGAASAVTIAYDATVTLTNGTPAEDMTMTPEVVGAVTNDLQATALVVVSGTTRTLVDDPATTLAVDPVYFLWVGGTIPALATQAPGIYAGTFNINVEYN